jgi:hypothetical protein
MLTLAALPRPALAAVSSLPGDADCDGLVTNADFDQLVRELADGDGSLAADADGGSAVSCLGADANGDGQVTAADFSSLALRLRGADGAQGPVVTFLGIASADGTTTMPAGDVPVPLYQAVGGLGFVLVIEATTGASGLPPGQALSGGRPELPPDIQVQVTRALGDGNLSVCGEGGVPGINPPTLVMAPNVTAALNDLACRFDVASTPNSACTIDQFGVHRFADSRTRVQFCLPISAIEAFPSGMSIVSARVRDTAGTVGPLRQIQLRVGTEPLVTVTPRPTATATGVPSSTVTATRAASGTATFTAPASPTATLTAVPSLTATRTATATGTQVASSTPTASASPTRTASRTPTGSVGPTDTRTRTETPSRTPSSTATFTRTRTDTPGPSPTATNTGVPTSTSTRTATRTASPAATRTNSSTPSPTRTPQATGTATASLTPSRTVTGTRPATATRTETGTPTVPPSVTVTRTRTASPTRTATATSEFTATRTPTRPSTATVTATRTRTLTPVVSFTPSVTATQTRTGVATRTATRTPISTATITATPRATSTRTVTVTGTVPSTATSTATRPATTTATPTISRTPTRTGTVTRTSTPTGTPTATRTPTITRTPSRTGTATRTATETRTPTITRTPSLTPTRTPTGRPGADITYVGVARASDEITQPIGTTSQGWPIFERPFGYSFSLVVEAKPGPSRKTVALSTFNSDEFDPSQRPDFEIIVSRPLGNGSTDVCDNMLPFFGGVPASTSFDETQPISNAINDLSCRFVNGSGDPKGRTEAEACTMFEDGNFGFVKPDTKVQFCALVAEPFSFPVGDTVVTVRVRDSSGQPGPPASFVVRVQP